MQDDYTTSSHYELKVAPTQANDWEANDNFCGYKELVWQVMVNSRQQQVQSPGCR